ncbi:MAG: DUF6491 family protein [Gammaproteobacteria bacterium]
MFLPLTALVAQLLLTGCATPETAPEASAEAPLPRALRCLRVDRIDNWRVIDSRQVIVYGPRRSQAWLLQVFPGCTTLRNSETLGFRTLGGDMLCGDPGDAILSRDVRCPIRSMRPISPAEEAALTDPDVRTDIGKMPPAERETKTEEK